MKRLASVLFSVGLAISAMVGLLHFAAPYAFGWYAYIPDAPQEILVSIDYVNFFFSLLLAGLSLLLLSMKAKIFAGSRDLLAFYGFLIFTWFCRVTITLIRPWPTSLQTWLLVGFGAEFILTLLPLFYLLPRQASLRQQPEA